jgi:hypothetical protein
MKPDTQAKRYGDRRQCSWATDETLSVNVSESAFERPVGIPAVSFATLALRYNLER